MKLPLIVSVFLVSCIVKPASCHQLRKAAGPADGVKGDYYTHKIQSENAGDMKRGDGSCKSWRRTLECDPSGARDPHADKACDVVIGATESGYCECGGYAQFAAVGCSHRPFTCETMCLKFAVVTGKPVLDEQGRLTQTVPMAAAALGPKMMAEQDLKVMEVMNKEAAELFDKARASSDASSKKAKDSLDKYHTVLNKAQLDDAVAGQKYMQGYADLRALGGSRGLGQVSGEYGRIGKRLQEIAAGIFPLQPAKGVPPGGPV